MRIALPGNKTALWITASLISLVLLALVVAQVNWTDLRAMLAGAAWSLIALALVLFTAEGVMTALRIRLFAGGRPTIATALKTNAWYVLLLVILPARLGEVAAILVFNRYLGQRAGAAAASIVTQRLYDVIVLGALFLIGLIGLQSAENTPAMTAVALILMALAVGVLIMLEKFLTLLFMILKRLPAARGTLLYKLRRLVLQARLYNRHGLKPRQIPGAVLLSLGKWTANLGAVVCLLAALHLGLPFFEKMSIAAAYDFLAIIPLQTIGGIGIGEAGLTLLLATAGIATPSAAGASLLIRVVILAFPFIFWGLVMGSLWVKERGAR